MQRLIQDLLAYSRVSNEGLTVRAHFGWSCSDYALHNLVNAVKKAGRWSLMTHCPTVMRR